MLSQRNKRKFVDDDSFVYVLNNTNKDGSVEYWTCEKKGLCRAKIHISNDRVIRAVGDHTHEPDINAVKASVVIDDIRREAETSQNSTRNLIRDAVANKDDSVLAALPSRAAMSRRIQRVRRRLNPCPPLPTSRHGFVVPTIYSTTSDGRRFLMYDSGSDDHDRILIYSTDENLDAMASKTDWFMDGTFKCAPEIFYQVFTIHVYVHGTVIPVLYALLPNKQQATYERLLRALTSLRQFDPTSVVTDFELASVNAVRNAFPAVVISGCFFHFRQCIFRKLQQCGLQRENREQDFNLFIRMLVALAFVPVNDIVDSFETLLDAHAPDSAQCIIDYFEETFIGRLTRRNARRQPVFPLNMWNVSARVTEALPKTNNGVEGWHRGFQSSLSCAHPTFWKFIEHLKKEEALQHFSIVQLMSGGSVLGRKKYRNCQLRIQTLMARYQAMTTVDFLRAVAHNITI
jgi:hypothetical protein